MSPTSRKSWWSTVCSQVGDFFFAREIPYGLAMVRILLPLAMLIPMVQRIPWVRELFSTDGAVLQISVPYGYGNLLPVFPPAVAVALYCSMIVLLLMTAIGWQTRFSIVGATILYIYFNCLDMVSTMTKYSAIAADIMLALCFARSGAVLSVDAWLKRRQQKVDREDLKSAVWPAKLIMFLFGAVYFGAAMTKVHTPEFFSGEQLRFWLLSNVNFDNPVGEYMATVPAMLVFSAYATIVWEIVFIFLVWQKKVRYLVLAVGALFHIMTCLTLGLYIFPAICLAGYMAFIPESDAEWLLSKCRFPVERQFTKSARGNAPLTSWMPASLRMPEQAVWGLALLFTSVVAVEADYRMDHYGASAGKMALKELDSESAQKLTQTGEAVREVDKYFSFEIGSFMVSGIVADSRREFQYGERIHVQVNLNPPHEDLWLECNLHDEQGRLVERNGMIVTRETLRTNFFYRLNNALEPGMYEFRFVSSGADVGSRRIALETTYQTKAPEMRVLAN